MHSVSASPGALFQFVTIGEASWMRYSVDPWEPVGQRLSPPLPPRFDDSSRAWLGARQVGTARVRDREAVEYEFYSAGHSTDTRVRLLVDAETGYPVRYETIDVAQDGVEPVSGPRASWDVRYDFPVVIEDPTKAARVDPGPLAVEAAGALLGRLPSLAGLAGDLQITRIAPRRVGRPDTDYLVESSWSASGKVTTGLAVVAPLAAFPPWLEYLASAAPWGLVGFEANRGLTDLVADQQKQRRAARESEAIGDLRSMLSGQVAFSRNHGSRFAPSVECLLQPATCCLEHPGESGYVSDTLARPERLGYRFTLHPGPTVRLESGASGPARFAYTALPTTPGGGAAFCVDALGTICRVDSGEQPAVEGGRCRRDGACRPQH